LRVLLRNIFVGDFDGTTFVIRVFSKDVQQKGLWLDYGKIIMRVLLGPTYLRLMEKLFIGWMSNWDYAQKVPTETWRSMTIPRELVLVKGVVIILFLLNRLKNYKNYIAKTIKKDALIIDKETVW
jgi:levanase/fructan beta-fructosidase